MNEIATDNWQAATRTSERIVRHRPLDRLYHWLMATCVFVLMGTAFLPILGIKFEWLDIHWITGVVLAALVLVHIVRALFFQDWRNMWIGIADLRDLWGDIYRLLGGRAKRLYLANTMPPKSSTILVLQWWCCRWWLPVF